MILRDVRDSKGFGGIFKDFNGFQYTLMVFNGFSGISSVLRNLEGFLRTLWDFKILGIFWNFKGK